MTEFFGCFSIAPIYPLNRSVWQKNRGEKDTLQGVLASFLRKRFTHKRVLASKYEIALIFPLFMWFF